MGKKKKPQKTVQKKEKQSFQEDNEQQANNAQQQPKNLENQSQPLVSGSEYDQEERLEKIQKDQQRCKKIKGDLKFSIQGCRDEIYDQLLKLNKYYKYKFDFDEQPNAAKGGKTMTRTIYLLFECNRCPQANKWTSISGTFQITFHYNHEKQLLKYHVQIFRTQCRKCKQYMQPFIYQTQMDAMRIFFSVIITNIIDKVPPPRRPSKYYIRENHWHKKQWCEACELGRCTTQYNKPSQTKRKKYYIRANYMFT